MVTEIATETKLAALRQQLPAVLATGYFNAGSYGPLPIVAHERLLATARAELEQGRIAPGAYERNRKRNRRVAALIAELFGADADEIALTHSTTEGLSIALLGLDWRPGDEVVTTRLEHGGLFVPLCLLARRYGVVLRVAEIGYGGGDLVGAIAAALSPKTRVIALSHVMWSTGAVIPLAEIAALARRHDLLTIVDGAQSAGHVPVELHALDVDVYAMSGQKWLCGPEATGALFVRRDRFADIAPTYCRYGQFDLSGYLLPAAGAMRYEVGEFNGPTVEALEATLRWLRDEVELDWAYARIAALGQRCWHGLSRIDGVTVLTPRERLAGLVCFAVDGLPPQAVTAQLFERNLAIRYVDSQPCPVLARAAVAWWNTEEEVDRLIAAVVEVAATAR